MIRCDSLFDTLSAAQTFQGWSEFYCDSSELVFRLQEQTEGSM